MRQQDVKEINLLNSHSIWSFGYIGRENRLDEFTSIKVNEKYAFNRPQKRKQQMINFTQILNWIFLTTIEVESYAVAECRSKLTTIHVISCYKPDFTVNNNN